MGCSGSKANKAVPPSGETPQAAVEESIIQPATSSDQHRIDATNSDSQLVSLGNTAASDVEQGPLATEIKKECWICESCQVQNSAVKMFCQGCHSVRPKQLKNEEAPLHTSHRQNDEIAVLHMSKEGNSFTQDKELCGTIETDQEASEMGLILAEQKRQSVANDTQVKASRKDTSMISKQQPKEKKKTFQGSQLKENTTSFDSQAQQKPSSEANSSVLINPPLKDTISTSKQERKGATSFDAQPQQKHPSDPNAFAVLHPPEKDTISNLKQERKSATSFDAQAQQKRSSDPNAFAVLHSGEKGTISNLKQRVVKLQILRAEQLAKADLVGLSDPYVVVKSNEKVLGQTEVIRKSLNPKWKNAFFMLDVPEDTASWRVTLAVYDHDFIGNDDFLGQLILDSSTLLSHTTEEQTKTLERNTSMSEKANKYVAGSIIFKLSENYHSSEPNITNDLSVPHSPQSKLTSYIPELRQNFPSSETTISNNGNCVQHHSLPNKDSSVPHTPRKKVAFYIPEVPITIHILRAHNLSKTGAIGQADPYVVIKEAGQMLGKTKVKKRTLNPVWADEKFVVNPPSEGESLDWNVVLQVYGHHIASSPDFLGQVILSRDILQNPPKPEMHMDLQNNREISAQANKYVHGSLVIKVERQALSQEQKVPPYDNTDYFETFEQDVWEQVSMEIDNQSTTVSQDEVQTSNLQIISDKDRNPELILLQHGTTARGIFTLNLDHRCLSANDIERILCAAQEQGISSLPWILSLDYNALRPTGATYLGTCMKIFSFQSLSLRGNSIQDVGASALARGLPLCSKLKLLDLCDNSIGNVGAAALAHALSSNVTIDYLDLHNNEIGDAGAAALGQALVSNQTLLKLDLESNLISDEGAGGLAKGLTSNTGLQDLYLRFNKIGDTGGVKLAQGLSSNSTLNRLNLGGNSIRGQAAKQALKDAWKPRSVTYLNLSSGQ